MVAMEIRNAVEQLRAGSGAAKIFDEPYETSDGTTIITVSRLHWRLRGNPIPVPVGVFSIRDGKALWVPATDHSRIALLGEVIGLAAAVIATAAVLRRPPWPDLSIPTC
ncbi:hypothetical protein FFI94_002705 [Rhodococcus sp. KBS0724]|nr:hypothetical protein [Rhodococcus sp. KBS0724]TSD45171.1 hypothetical protein FFI94_002705 [Rhodococcus sp. KBS0724]